MENLCIAKTKYTPEINFNYSDYLLTIKGESYPENTSKFYGPVMSSLLDFLDSLGDQEVTLNIELDYFNSSSSKVLMDLFDTLDERVAIGKKIIVNWLYEPDSDSAMEYGEEFKEDVQHLTFNLMEKTPS